MRLKRTRVLLASILSFVLCNVAGAQNLDGLHVGARIRIRTPVEERWQIGTYEGGTKDSLWIGQCDRCRSGEISFEDIRELDVSQALPRARSKQVIFSTLLGMTAGAIGGRIAGPTRLCPDSACPVGNYNAVFFGVIGGFVGAAVGAMVPVPREHWLKVLPRQVPAGL